ncbi:MAG TPA: SLBB domain-containing protein, partial [Rhizomicrobium sp.]|nr:SLBB domain-containing protein [Rhizomicrobium sp.]
YVATDAFVSVATVRQISVLVSGAVDNPGLRTLSGLSSVVDALLLSGGVKKTGSLRDIRIQRMGQQHVVDLYSVLTGGSAGGGMRLADGDRIIVPPLANTVAVAGLVRRPGIYELPARTRGMSARALLSLAGGQEVRGRYRLSVQRIEPDGRLNLVALPGDTGVIRDSEILRVELNADLATSQATLSGGVGLAGRYAVIPGTRLSDVIKAPGALGTSPYALFGLIVRKDPRTLMRSLIAFTPAAVLSGTEDMPLQMDDTIRPITVGESQLLTFVLKTYLSKLALDQARIRNPLETSAEQAAEAAAAANAQNSSSNNNNNNSVSRPSVIAITAAPVSPDNPFGLRPGALDEAMTGQEDFSSVPADLQRSNIIALLNMAAPGTLLAQQRQLAYQQSLQTANAAGVQTPAQMAQAQQAALLASQTGTPPYSQGPQQAGGISPDAGDSPSQIGPDGLPVQTPPPNYQDQPVGPGDYATNREARTFGELSRQLEIDPLVLVNFLIDHQARLDGAVRGPGPYFVGPNASLADLVQAAGGTVSWADESGVELLTTAVDSRNGRAATQRQTLPLRQGTLASYIVRPKDQLHFNKVFTDTGIGSVSVQGEVRFAGNYPITRGEHLSDLLMRAGGLNSIAYPAGTVFLRKSAAQIEEQGYKRAANEIQSQLLAGMARIGSDKISGEGFTAIQAFIAQLRNQKGL